MANICLHLDKKILLSSVILRNTPFTYDKQIGDFRNLLKVFKSYFIGVYVNKEMLISTNEAEILFDQPRLLQLDGEVIGKFERLKVNMLKGAVKLITHHGNTYLT